MITGVVALIACLTLMFGCCYFGVLIRYLGLLYVCFIVRGLCALLSCLLVLVLWDCSCWFTCYYICVLLLLVACYLLLCLFV